MHEVIGIPSKSDLIGEYGSCLKSYISTGDNSYLREASGLGDCAVKSGRSLGEMIEMHGEVLGQFLISGPDPSRLSESLSRASTFLAECLTPFEAARRGFTKAGDDLKLEITDGKRVERGLEGNESYYKSLTENSQDLINILRPDGIVEYCSPSSVKVLGYAQEELLGGSFFQYVHHGDINNVLEFFEDGISRDDPTLTVEFRYKHKNGYWITLESTGKNLVADPQVGGIVLSSRDITDRRNLEEMRRRYEFIANASKELMALVNRDYVYEAANEALCAALNRKRHEVVGKRVSDIWGEDRFRKFIRPAVDSAFQGNEEYRQAWFDMPQLGGRFLEVSFYPYRDLLGAVTHVAVISRDITDRKRNEDEIINSHMRLEEAQSVAHVGSWELNIQAKSLLCSEEMMNILGQQPDHIVLSFAQFVSQVYPVDRDKVVKTFDAAPSRGEEFGLNHRIVRPDGSVRIVHTRGRVVKEYGDRSVKVIGTTQDLTEQQLAREAVEAYEIRYRRLFETSKDGVLLIDAGTGKITDVNPVLIWLLGYDKSDFVGRHLAEVDAAKGIEKSGEVFRRALAEEHLLENDLVLRSKAGVSIHLEFVSISYVVKDAKIIQCHFWNITERKQLEEALQSSEERFRSLIENASDVIAIIERDGRFKYVSPSVMRVLGYRPEELVGKSALNLINPDAHADFKAAIARVAENSGGPRDFFEFHFKAQDSTWRILEATARNLLDVPPVMGILLNARDITEKKLLMNKLKAAAWQREEDMRKFAMSVQQAQEEERRRIAMELHDDICQRLTAMRLNLTVLQDNIEIRKKSSRRQWQSIKKEIDNVATEVRRISSNLRPSALDHFGLVTALRLICSEMERVQNFRVEFQAGALLRQHYDPSIEIAVFRIAQEALANSAKHSGVDRARMRLEQNGKMLEFTATDDGKGFAEFGYLQKLRGEHHMGLMNIKERARLLGGDCSINSSPGHGTSIHVRIPITEG